MASSSKDTRKTIGPYLFVKVFMKYVFFLKQRWVVSFCCFENQLPFHSPPHTFLNVLTFISLKHPVFEPLFEARLEIKGKRCQRSRTYYERFAWEQYKSVHGFRVGKISVPKERDDSNPTYFEHFSVLTVWPMLMNYFQKMHVRRNILASGAVCLYY